MEATLLVKQQLSYLEPWLEASIEVAEICSKALDWKIKSSQMGELVSQQYLLFLDDISKIVSLNEPSQGL